MAFCSNCGTQLNEDANFCHVCGKAIRNTTQQTREQNYAGKIIKCPNCGETLSSFVTNCPACGHELRGVQAIGAVKEFQLKFERTQNVDEKIGLIKAFAIPNTKEDIYEFMIMAMSNIEPDLYDDTKNTAEIALSSAWMAKFEQSYQKARKLFPDESDYQGYYKIVQEKKKRAKKLQKIGKRNMRQEKTLQRRSAFFKNNTDIIIGIFLIVIALLVFSSLRVPHMVKEYKLERLVEEVEICIANNDFEMARIKANQIIDDTGWSSESTLKWNDIRNSLLETIEEKEAELLGKVLVDVVGSDLSERNYLEVEQLFKEKGFANIRLEPIKDLVTGWLTNDGEVESVTIGGISNYSTGTYFAADTEVVITYHTFKEEK